MWLIVHHGDEVSFGELVSRYVRRLRPGPLRCAVFDMGRLPDPFDDAEGFRKAKWYQEDALLTLETIRQMEDRLLLTRIHHDASPGPLLGPSRSGPVTLPPLPRQRSRPDMD
ncbi:hypothetical protein BJF83_17520 [Nocardiopsis sp. CNR-923]|nr:hypothetical protein BJF83_17520 [Nocardiopsis sp. CNR-923]